MDDRILALIETGSEENVKTVLLEFNKKNAQTFSFPELDVLKKKLVDGILKCLRDESFFDCHQTCLETVRILSREKRGLEEVFTKDILDTMLQLAGMVTEEELVNNQVPVKDPKVIIEAQKSLCNLIFNSTGIQRICCYNKCVEGIMMRLKTYKDPDLLHEVKFFDMRMLFLLTALCADIRPKLRTEHHGLIYLMEIVDLIMKSNAERNRHRHKGSKRFSKSSRRGRSGGDSGVFPIPCLDDEEVDLASEVLKVLFNLTVNVDKLNMEEEEEAHFMRLVSILHDILLCDTKTPDKKEELHNHTINLLNNMPHASYEELLTPLTDIPGGKTDNKNLQYEGMNMEAVSVILEFLQKKMDQPNKKQRDFLIPILSCLGECARSNRIIRKWMKIKVLPPLKDVRSKPEEGDTLRNRLVRLMTSPYTDIKELVADFLFVLCKENVNRLVKYTGYGNAAGLLANRGLMLGGQSSGACNYSSESEESDTEEYLACKERINPVKGCYESPRPNPMEGLTDEQKEQEAMELLNMMAKLARDGIVQPMRVGTDGKPHPVKHIPEHQKEEDSEETDSN
ncbi:synembryn-A-like isoform X2 [Limulus polyphemus]|uniref:Synembryn-A-like isoform X2 n=1 Tax=Limulus polyphemus TaxID=6850 RepID=A0ABM1T1R4_LIMPO|nr:synembryn-A-like isoform X2 [Limulus polyphemus]